MPAPAEPAAPAAPARGAAAPVDAGPMEAPAGFWRRAAAWCVDMALLSPLLVLLCRGPAGEITAATLEGLGAVQEWLLGRVLGGADVLRAMPSPLALAHELLADPALHAQLLSAQTRLGSASLQLFLRAAGVAALWFIGFEASPWQATPGKRLAGLRVTDMASARPGPARAAVRFFAGALSWLTLNLGHALAGWRRDHRALHDLVAGTQVLGRGPTPRWVGGVVGLLVAGAVLLPFALVARVLQAVAGG